VEVPTVDGKTRLKIPPGVQSGQKLRMRGKGAMKPDGTRGDQIVVVEIHLPPSLTQEEISLLKELERKHPYNPRPF
jgi:DnaJ-class molecular chaperone